MASRFSVIPVPDMKRDLIGARRVIDQNFHAINDLLNRAIKDGTILADGTVTETHLSTDAKTLTGDVTGTVGSLGSTSVVKIRNKSVDAPGAGDNAKLLAYNHSNSDFDWVDCLRDVLTTRGDLLIRGASAEDRLPIGAANRVLKSDGTDPSWTTVTLLLDVIGSTRGNILARGAATWGVIAVGASGKYLGSDGTDPVWTDPPAAGAHNLLSATHSDTTSASVVRGDIITGQNGPVWARLALGASGKYLKSDGTDAVWADPPAGSAHNLLSGTHSDADTETVVRGDLVFGNSTPKWDRLALGARRYLLSNDGSDVVWHDPKRFSAPSYYVQYCRGAFAYGVAFLTGGAGNVRAVNSSGTPADAADADRAATSITSATTADGGWRSGAGALEIQARHRPYCRFDLKVTDNVDGCIWGGLLALASGSSAADPGAAAAAFRARNGTDTNFMAVTHDGTTVNATDTGVAIDANWHDFEIFTDDAGVTWYFYIDGALVATKTTNVPGTTTGMCFQLLQHDVTSSTRSMSFSYCMCLLGKAPTV